MMLKLYGSVIVALCVLIFNSQTNAKICKGDFNLSNMTKAQCRLCANRRWISSRGYCQECISCQPGTGLSQVCGNGRGNDRVMRCIPCNHTDHRYSNTFDSNQCKRSPQCHTYNRVYNKTATPKSRAICGPCMKGYFHSSDMTFSPDRLTECDQCSIARSVEDVRACSRYFTTVEPDEKPDRNETKNETLISQPHRVKPASGSNATIGVLAGIIGSGVLIVLVVVIALEVRKRRRRRGSESVSNESFSQKDDVENKEECTNCTENANSPLITAKISDERKNVDLDEHFRQYEESREQTFCERNSVVSELKARIKHKELTQKASEEGNEQTPSTKHKTEHEKELNVGANGDICGSTSTDDPLAIQCNMPAQTQGTRRVQTALRVANARTVVGQEHKNGRASETWAMKEQNDKAREQLRASPTIQALRLKDLNKDARDRLCNILNVGDSYIDLAYSVFDNKEPNQNYFELNKKNLPDRCHDVFERFILEKNMTVLELIEHIDKIEIAAASYFLVKYLMDNYFETTETHAWTNKTDWQT